MDTMDRAMHCQTDLRNYRRHPECVEIKSFYWRRNSKWMLVFSLRYCWPRVLTEQLHSIECRVVLQPSFCFLHSSLYSNCHLSIFTFQPLWPFTPVCQRFSMQDFVTTSNLHWLNKKFGFFAFKKGSNQQWQQAPICETWYFYKSDFYGDNRVKILFEMLHFYSKTFVIYL